MNSTNLTIVRTVIRGTPLTGGGVPKRGTRYVIELGGGDFAVEEWPHDADRPITVAGPFNSEAKALAALDPK